MKLVTCIVRPERLHAVKEALFQVGVTGMTLVRVSGHGGEKELVEMYRATSVVLEFREKVKIEMAVSEPFVEPTIRAILASARTGEVGDGKIFVQAIEQVLFRSRVKRRCGFIHHNERSIAEERSGDRHSLPLPA